MIDVNSVIVLNPANPAAKPGCPNWVCWVLPGLTRKGQKKRNTEVEEGCCHALK